MSVYVDDTKLAGKKQNISPTWKILIKVVDLGEPPAFLDSVYLGCTQRECQISKDIVINNRNLFESRISVGASEKLPLTKATGNLMPKRYLHGPMTWKVMQRNAWKDIANSRIKHPSNYKVATPCMDDHQFKEEGLGSVGELSKNALKLSKNACIWHA